MPTWNHQSLQSSTTCLDCQGSHDLLSSLQLAMGILHSIEVDRDHLVAPPLALHRLELHENVAVIEEKKQKDLILPRNLEKFYKSSYFPESDRSSLPEFLEARYPWVGILGSQIRWHTCRGKQGQPYLGEMDMKQLPDYTFQEDMFVGKTSNQYLLFDGFSFGSFVSKMGNVIHGKRALQVPGPGPDVLRIGNLES